MNGSISVGGLVAAVGLAQFLVNPLQMVGWVSARLAQGRASAARVAELLSTPHAVGPGQDTAPPGRSGGALQVRGLTHGGLDGLDLDLAPGELLGVVALDPAHAGDLLRCLAREVEPEAGLVELDGVPLTDLPPDVGADGCAGRRPRRTPVQRNAPGQRAGRCVPGPRPGTGDGRRAGRPGRGQPAAGRDTEIAARGSSLSGGQRQRVALARALAANAPVLVLHDPTTAVDTVTEARIAAGLRDVRRGPRTLLVTTSPALLAVADRVVVLADGRIASSGTHDELMADPDYRAVVTG